MHNKNFNKLPNKIIEFLLKPLLIGIFTAGIIVSFLLYFDIGGLNTLIKQTNSELIAYPLLFILFSITFGSLAMGIAIMGINDDDDEPKGGTKIKNKSFNIDKHTGFAHIP